MALGVGGQILPETLGKMVDNCGAVFVDIQASIRVFDTNERVKVVGLKESGCYHLLPHVKFLYFVNLAIEVISFPLLII